MALPKKDVSVVRRLVIAAFTDSQAANYGSGSMSDYGVRVQAGGGDGPTGKLDLEAIGMRRRLNKLNQEDYRFLSYLYNASTNKHKPWPFIRVWHNCQALFKGKNQSTQETSALMLQALLSCYRYKILQGRDYPAHPWKEFDGMTPAMWKRTYKNIWSAMADDLARIDEQLLMRLS